ncbi:MAG TPA: SCO family protein [Candidatus Sulfotelmatobacter sp.]|nr:SCO family protein [Candidatus Sulfotelmatobacter sp.]
MARTRRPYSAEFRRRLVELVRGGQTPEDLARKFEPSANAIRNWVVQAARDEGQRADGLTTDEKEEVRRLRREGRGHGFRRRAGVRTNVTGPAWRGMRADPVSGGRSMDDHAMSRQSIRERERMRALEPRQRARCASRAHGTWWTRRARARSAWKAAAVSCAVVVAACVMPADQVRGHAILMESTPKQDDAVANPRRVVLRFNSRIEKKLCTLNIVGPGQSNVILLRQETDAPPDTLIFHLPELAPGAYRVRWKVMASDGHMTEGGLRFSVSGEGVPAIAAGSAGSVRFKGASPTPVRAAADFALTSQNGTEFRMSGERGNVVALWFGYTFCPDVCPMTLSELIQARQRLGERGKRFRIVFVTVDPERDTVARLREYARGFGGGFTALTGSADQLAQVRKAYGVVAQKRVVAGTAAAYLVDHSAFVYLVDPAGQLRVMFPFGMSIDDMVHDIKVLLE